MWDFLIVLGQVPGTSFQITFYEILLSVASCSALYVIYKHNAQFRREIRGAWIILNLEIKTARKVSGKTINRQRKVGQKYLAAFKTRLRIKSPVNNLRGIPATKLHARQRTA